MDNSNDANGSKRGVFLWAVLVLYIFLWLQRLITLIFPRTFSEIYANGPAWGYEYNLVMFVAITIGLAGIFSWKKWGLYLIAIVDITAIVIDQVYFAPRPSIWVAISSLALVSLLIWAVTRKWQLFK